MKIIAIHGTNIAVQVADDSTASDTDRVFSVLYNGKRVPTPTLLNMGVHLPYTIADVKELEFTLAIIQGDK